MGAGPRRLVVALTDRPDVRGGRAAHGADSVERVLLVRPRVRARNDVPGAPVPVLGERVPKGLVRTLSTDGPDVSSRDSAHSVQHAARPDPVRTGDVAPGRPIPVQ